MSEHFTRNTTAIMKYCNRCGKNTMHKVSGKKLGLCMENHMAQPDKKPAVCTEKQESLFL